MGTFHDNLGDLHGVTVVVKTDTGLTYVGRCHSDDDAKVIMHDVDVHDVSESEIDVHEYLTRASKWGVFAKHKTLMVDKKQVGFTEIIPLNQLAI